MQTYVYCVLNINFHENCQRRKLFNNFFFSLKFPIVFALFLLREFLFFGILSLLFLLFFASHNVLTHSKAFWPSCYRMYFAPRMTMTTMMMVARDGIHRQWINGYGKNFHYVLFSIMLLLFLAFPISLSLSLSILQHQKNKKWKKKKFIVMRIFPDAFFYFYFMISFQKRERKSPLGRHRGRVREWDKRKNM